jgi:GntR family transcriptional regulator/MocR family aminotransferase
MSTSSPELLVELDRSRPRSLRSQLEAGLRAAIRDGRLPSGTRLASSRALARDLEITRGVVVAAYAQLEAEGFVATRQGAGTVVNSFPRPSAFRPPDVPSAGIRYDLRPGSADTGLFPHAAWARAASSAMRSLPSADLGYGHPAGLKQLREALAQYLGRVRGVYCEPDHVVVCNGVSHGMSLVLRALTERGHDRIAVEDPGLPVLRGQIASAGAVPCPVPVDGEGLRVADLTASAATALLATPAHQYPAGVVLGPERRRELIEWARTGVVVEDDYDAEYRYDGQPVGALQGLAPDRVIYCGSASKSLAPGLRLGWLVAPDGLRDEIIAVREMTDRFTNIVTQATFAEFLQRGDLDRHLRKTRRSYRERRDVLAGAIAEHIPGAYPTGIAAGLHAVVNLPAGMDAERIAAAALRRGVPVYPLSHFRTSAAPRGPALVIGYARLSPRQLEEAIQILALVIAD